MHLSDIFLLFVLSGVNALSEMSVSFVNSEPENSQLFLGKYKIPKETNSPINIDSKKVIEENDLEPLSLHAALSDKVKVVNTGKVVEVIAAQKDPKSSVTGGVLKKDKYIFKKIRYIWADNTTGISGSAIDNKGYPLENVAVFYKEEYQTFENALNYRDGLAEVDFQIGICSKPNEKFDEYEKKLKEIQKPGSVETTLGTAIGWFAGNGVIPPESPYHAYPGSYSDEQEKKHYSTTIILLSHLLQWCLSENQFEETYGSFETSSGKRLTASRPSLPQKMPVVRAKGILNSNTP